MPQFVCFTFQGQFNTWLDGTPVSVSNWYNPKLLSDTQLNLLDVYNGEVVKTDRQTDIFTFNSSEKHSNYYYTNNCSAIAPYKFYGAYVWVDIPCNKTVNAWYVCQTSRRKPALQTSVITNETCDEGWILVAGTGKCFIVLKPQHEISFLSAKYVCNVRNSSLLSITTQSSAYTEAEHKTILSAFAKAVTDERRAKLSKFVESKSQSTNSTHFSSGVLSDFTFTHIGHSYDGSKLTNLLYGERLNKNSSVYKVSNILIHSLQLYKPTVLKVFANVHGGCGIIEYLSILLSNVFVVKRSHLEDWGAKNRSCYVRIDVDFLVCEKESWHADVRCGIGYFKCDDGTCILSVYKCDHDKDCFDGSDESYCELTQTLNDNTSISARMILSCQLNYNCSLPTAQISIYIHSICDGIYSDTILVEEKTMCTPSALRKLNISALQVNIHSRPMILHSLALGRSEMIKLLYEEEYHQNIRHTDLNNKSDMLNMKAIRKYNCFENCEIKYILERCKIDIHRRSVGFMGDICRYILCPGMFKCHSYYCIPIASVCDGQGDCLYNDDERFCDTMVCPGSLKCRAENRCVSSDSICDGISDCLHTFDDELLCDNCPAGCTCQGYVMLCTESVASRNRSINYAKAIILKTDGPSFQIEYTTPHLLYLDIASCSFTDIKLQLQWVVSETRLLFTDVSKNQLTSLQFLKSYIYLTIHSLDASHNAISHIHGAHIVKCEKLFVLKLSGNPIIHINLQSLSHNIKLIEIKEVPFHPKMAIFIQTKCEVHVTHSIVCCVLPDNVKCTTEQTKHACLGLLNNMTGYIVYSIAMLLFVILVILVWRLTQYRYFVKSAKKYYYIAIINVKVADTFLILYYLSLALADIMNVRIIFWTKSTSCAILNVIVSTVLHCSLAFKVISSLVVALKIIYPFKDQHQYLKYSTMLCQMIWMLAVCPHSVQIIINRVMKKHIFLDTFCSPFDCHANLNTYIFYGRFLDAAYILMFTVAEICTYVSLQRSNYLKQKNNISTLTPVFSVCFKIGKPIYLELSFRLIVVSLYICKYFTFCDKYCFVIVLYLMPLNVLISCIFLIF